MTKKIIIFLFNTILLVVSICLLTTINIYTIGNLFKIILLICMIGTYILSYLFKLFKLQKLYKFSYVIFVILTCIVSGYIILYKSGILNTLSSVHSLKEYILSTKEKGVLVYILIQLAQVIIVPIPAAIICIVGSMIYGPLLSGIYCSIGVLIGSYISFLIGKTFGYKIVNWIVGKENTDKYSEIIRKRGGFFLILAFPLPMFPDDILCLISGITNMNFKTFFWITLVTRPIGVICMSYFGGGYLIPFSGWGIYALSIILVFVIIFTIVLYKYQENIQNFILNNVFKKKNKN